MKKYIYSLMMMVLAVMFVTSCVEIEGTEAGNDTEAHVVVGTFKPDLPYDPDCDIFVRISANNASSDIYYLVEKTADKDARNMSPEAYADYVVSNGTKVSADVIAYNGSKVAELVVQGLSGDNTISVVGVGGGKKHLAQKTFFGIKWNDVTAGSYTFFKKTIANMAGSATMKPTLQQREDQPETFRFKNVYGPTHHLIFKLLPDYTGSDEHGSYVYARVETQATGLTHASYGAVNVRDVGYWQNDDNFVLSGGFESRYYPESKRVSVYVQYYVSAGNLGYGKDLFVAE